jgi:NAD(P)H-dependent FMN reductase
MDRCQLAVVVASTRPGRIGPGVARWFADRASRRPDVRVDLLDLADGPLPPERVARAEAVVVVTPEYNHSFPGPLKTAVDALRDEWRATPVGFVSYGGISGGLRAVEQLRLVFAELHAVTVRETVSFHDVHSRLDADGRFATGEDGAGAAADVLLDQLVWWSAALRGARPYPGVPR